MKLSRLVFTFFLVLVFLGSSHAQSDETGRKGDILVESGSSLFAFSNTGGTGGGFLAFDGLTFGNLYLDVGKFVSNKFAVKIKGALLYTSNQFTVRSLAIGGKYYMANKIPIELNAGLINPFDNSLFIGNAKIGYAIPLASNINLEPSISLVYLDSTTATNINLSFAMFL